MRRASRNTAPHSYLASRGGEGRHQYQECPHHIYLLSKIQSPDRTTMGNLWRPSGCAFHLLPKIVAETFIIAFALVIGDAPWTIITYVGLYFLLILADSYYVKGYLM